jgi:hypothetical protein
MPAAISVEMGAVPVMVPWLVMVQGMPLPP